jgi:hypothetical protein
MRKSLKDKRDPVDFEREKKIQAFLHQQVAAGKLLIYYFDGSGFTTTPCVPYGWQKQGETRRLPTAHSKRLNVLGFMSLSNDSFFHTVEGRVDSQAAIAAFNAFAARYAEEFAQTKRLCFVILDNASIHTSKAFLAKRDDWMLAGICLHFLPTYSPELNPIEILWRKIKYEWLPLDAYKSYKDMKEQVLAILAEFGKKYTITFG